LVNDFENFGEMKDQNFGHDLPKIWSEIYQKFGQRFTKNLVRDLPKIWSEIYQKIGERPKFWPLNY